MNSHDDVGAACAAPSAASSKCSASTSTTSGAAAGAANCCDRLMRCNEKREGDCSDTAINSTNQAQQSEDRCMTEHEYDENTKISGSVASDDDDTDVDNQLLDALEAMPELDDYPDNPSSMEVDACNVSTASTHACMSNITTYQSYATQQQHKWIHAIQNASYQPKPTAFSPHGCYEENPLLGQQRQCRDKLEALASVRKRVQFLPFVECASGANTVDTPVAISMAKRSGRLEPSMKIHTHMVLSTLDNDISSLAANSAEYYASAGIETLAGLESLFFAFLTHRELVRVSEVCRSWKDMARHNVIWEPLLITPCERYPLRELLGIGADLPAIQVFMIFKRLRLSELPQEAQRRLSAVAEPRRHHAAQHVRFAEERHRLLTLMRGAHQNRPVNELALPLLNPTSHAHAAASMSSIHVLGFPSQCTAAAAVAEEGDDVDLQDDFVELLAETRARGDREGELHFVKEGYARTTLRAWLQRRRKVSERLLRSLLRQLLLAIAALEEADATHTAISVVNVIVLERATTQTSDTTAAATDSEVSLAHQQQTDAAPLFQLDCSRGVVFASRSEGPLTMQRQQAPLLLPLHRPERRFDMLRERRREEQHVAAALHEDIEFHGDDGGMFALAEDILQRQVRMPCMLNALFRCMIRVWSRGRFPDTSVHTRTSLLHLLVLHHAHIPAGLRSFLEYGKFLTDAGSVTAAHMLRHAYVADPCGADTIAIRAIPAQDVLNYQASVHTWYSCAHTAAQTATRQQRRDRVCANGGTESLSEPLASHKLMPRTQMAAAYFEHALKEQNLPHERFTSIVAPEIQSSSWIRKVAETQRHTLQRLDLSSVMLPTSVLLQELAHLPRITHLRLPTNIERSDDLEHFVAALSCTDLLPNLLAMDENVKLAMDRIEQTYLEQLNMVEFLLGR